MRNDRAIERAEEMVEREREAGVAHARAGLDRQGTADCIACGEPIEPSRRAALPSATRCVMCQGRHERRRGRDI